VPFSTELDLIRIIPRAHFWFLHRCLCVRARWGWGRRACGACRTTGPWAP
jgi:hypothetical protein